jgi:hypothetical protein
MFVRNFGSRPYLCQIPALEGYQKIEEVEILMKFLISPINIDTTYVVNNLISLKYVRTVTPEWLAFEIHIWEY